MTHTCPPTQINTNNDEGRIQRELCLGITVRKREILHPHNKTWFHTKKHVVIQKHGIFHLHNKYDKKKPWNFSTHTHSSTNYCGVPHTQPHLDLLLQFLLWFQRLANNIISVSGMSQFN
jgi:hypothetical protein